MKFYVYQLTDLENNVPFYIGKGTDQRMYRHVEAARRTKGIPTNRHLERKIRNIINSGGEVGHEILIDALSEQEALDLEMIIIDFLGIENLCNITVGGVGGDCLTNHPNYNNIRKKMGDSRRGKPRTPEVIQRMKEGMAKWRASDVGKAHFRQMSESRKGVGNPMYGHKEAPEKTLARMKKLRTIEPWSKGKTKEDDPRIAKLGAAHIGKIPHNAQVTKFYNNITKEVVEGRSLVEAAKLANIPLITASRLKRGIYKSNKKGWVYIHG